LDQGLGCLHNPARGFLRLATGVEPGRSHLVFLYITENSEGREKREKCRKYTCLCTQSSHGRRRQGSSPEEALSGDGAGLRLSSASVELPSWFQLGWHISQI